MLTPREIIAQAWTIATTERSLKRWGFFGTFFEMLLDVKLLLYQVYFAHAYFAEKEVGLFDDVIWMNENLPLWVTLTIVIAFLILVIIELFVPSFAAGAMIGLSAKAHNKEPVQGGFVLALYNFFPILAVHEVFVFSSLPILVTAISVILRYGGGFAGPMIAVALVVWMVSNVLKFFSTFVEPAVVVEKLGIFEAGAKSVKLIMSFLPHVMFLMMLLLIITLRIVLNTLIITLVPAAVMGSSLLFTYFFSPITSIVIATLIGLVLTIVAAYFFMYIHVFKHAVWTIMYMELIKEKEVDKIG